MSGAAGFHRSPGSISLQLENCNSGTVTYDLPGVPASGVIPIQRVALDGVGYCEILAYAVAR